MYDTEKYNYACHITFMLYLRRNLCTVCHSWRIKVVVLSKIIIIIIIIIINVVII